MYLIVNWRIAGWSPPPFFSSALLVVAYLQVVLSCVHYLVQVAMGSFLLRLGITKINIGSMTIILSSGRKCMLWHLAPFNIRKDVNGTYHSTSERMSMAHTINIVLTLYQPQNSVQLQKIPPWLQVTIDDNKSARTPTRPINTPLKSNLHCASIDGTAVKIARQIAEIYAQMWGWS